MQNNIKKTTKPIAKIASKGLKSSKKDKSVDASALVQVQLNKETGKKVSPKAGKRLQDPKASPREKKVAGSVLSQTPRKK